MNFFSSDVFLECAREAFFDKKNVSIGLVEVEGVKYRVLLDAHKRPLTQYPFLDVLEPCESTQGAEESRYIEPVDIGRVGIADWIESPDPEQVIGPYIYWSDFVDIESYIENVKAQSSFAFRTKKRTKVLQKLVGSDEVVFQQHNPQPRFIDECLAWKSKQYTESGFRDVTKGGAPKLFHLLFQRGALSISTLTAGNRTLAIHLGPHHDRTFYYWMTAYDTDLYKGSPGTLMLEAMLRESFGRSDHAFDFLEGNEPYKFTYATHVRLIGGRGVPPLHSRLLPPLKDFAKEKLKKYPRVLDQLRAWKNEWTERNQL